MIYPATDTYINNAAQAIQKGEGVAFPTETVYGLGANALNATAVAKIFEIKQRPFFDPLIVHVDSHEMVKEVVASVPDIAARCMETFWPGPLTLVLPKKHIIPEIVTAGLDTVAVRMPKHQVAQKLIQKSGVPIAAPSANPFGYLSPTTAGHVASQLGDKVAIILDGGQCPIGVESTIIKVDGESIIVLRHGGVPVEEIEAIAGSVTVTRSVMVEAPGQLPFHYAPHTKIVLIKTLDNVPDDSSCGLLLFKKRKLQYKNIHILYLSDDGDMRQAAANLFTCLHALDAMNLSVIYAEEVPQVGLGKAIMDRLLKAKARHS
ncbi:MAG: L-threonylcarbamoyladenylate synthase [Spirochaetes bacterium]|nr:L-threonylcarbamoyladenylate synthase [Spirochaetota bacterium]